MEGASTDGGYFRRYFYANLQSFGGLAMTLIRAAVAKRIRGAEQLRHSHVRVIDAYLRVCSEA